MLTGNIGNLMKKFIGSINHLKMYPKGLKSKWINKNSMVFPAK